MEEIQTVQFEQGETLFFANGGTIESHICKGFYELEGKITYVVTPHGSLNTVSTDKCFKTFEEAKQFIIDEATRIEAEAIKQVETVKNISEEDIIILSSEKPTEEELVADDIKQASK